jgi:hypothetical protein
VSASFVLGASSLPFLQHKAVMALARKGSIAPSLTTLQITIQNKTAYFAGKSSFRIDQDRVIVSVALPQKTRFL